MQLFFTAFIHSMHDIGSPLGTILHQHYQSDTHDLQVLKLVTLMLYTIAYYLTTPNRLPMY